jgi:glycosidase
MGDWWRDGVVYQVYPRSFADASGDGVGDLAGLTARLGHIAGLGADAIWVTPFQPSPQKDHGYDVRDYCDVDPLFGDLTAFDVFLERAHALGLRVVIDVVPNHCSSERPVFRAALDGDPDARARFHFADAPNNWPSVYGTGDRARAALLTILGLPGAAYLYQGQEYGLPEVDVPAAARQDPGVISRDGCRVPLPWASGFSPPGSEPPWLPVPAGWDAHLDSPTLPLCRSRCAGGCTPRGCCRRTTRCRGRWTATPGWSPGGRAWSWWSRWATGRCRCRPGHRC